MKWTDDQLRAIQTTGTSLLVSAAAGSGKTAVLAERCAYLICDAPQPCQLDQLLVVTFTNAAASEMRGRIERTLRDRLDSNDDPRLHRQLLLLGRAQIDTLHGFCARFLRRHFHVVGLDPNFRLLDAEESKLLHQEAARDVLDAYYDRDNAEEFRRFIDRYADGNDQRVLEWMLKLHDWIQSFVDPNRWVESMRANRQQAIRSKSLADTSLGAELARSIQDWLAANISNGQRLIQMLQPIKGLEKYVGHVKEILSKVEECKDLFGKGDFDNLAAVVRDAESPKLPTIKSPPPEKKAMQERIDAWKHEIYKSAMFQYGRFTEDQWRDTLARTEGPIDLILSLVADFAAELSRVKRDLRSLDFSDLERFTLDILRDANAGEELTPSAIALQYQQQFQQVLVDEYQDINPIQDAILTLLSRPDNLFCVGDVKQSIYRFRLAQPERFLDRYDQFSNASHPGTLINLSTNFRSRGPLLEVINSLFERVMTRDAAEIEYDQSHRLVAGATFPPTQDDLAFTGAPVELHLLPESTSSSDRFEDTEDDSNESLDRTEREALFVAGRVRQMIASKKQVADKQPDGSLVSRPVRYRDIVILLRSMKAKAHEFTQALRAAGIPAFTDASSGFFDSTEIRDILSLLRVLDNQQQDIPLAAVLRSPIANLSNPDDALARIRLFDRRNPFHQNVVDYARRQEDALAVELKRILTQLQRWRRLAHQRPMAEVVWQIYDESGYLAFNAGLLNGAQRVANLIEFHERASQFGTFQRQGLGRFMEFIQTLSEQTDLGQPSVDSAAEDVVRVMSIHSAKGLEFPVVFIPDLGKKHNLQDSRSPILLDRAVGIGLMVADVERGVRYPSLPHVLAQERIRRQSMAEELRILYVAMTRAKEHLVLIGTCKPQRREEWHASATHTGPLVSEQILSAATVLDWVGPAAAMLEYAALAHRFEITWHEEIQLPQSLNGFSAANALTDAQQKLARLQPLHPTPAPDPSASRLIDLLTQPYAFAPFTLTPASQSVGSLTKSNLRSSFVESFAPQPSADRPTELHLPLFAVVSQTLAPTDRGTATHLVLEQLDFSRRCDLEDLSLQIGDLIRRKSIGQTMANAVDRDAIVWLMNSPLGKIMRANAATLRREVPIYYPISAADAPPSNDPSDCVMVRGRIDLLIPDSSGLIIADYKTDAVNESTIAQRIESYRGQVQSYRQAISAITDDKKLPRGLLVFLQSRVIHELD